MADTDSYVLPEVNTEEEYARQLEQAQFAERRRQNELAVANKKRQKLLSQTNRQQKNQAAGQLSIAGEAQTVARAAYTRVWQMAEEGIEDFALSFADLMIFSGPAALGMFIVRLIGGNLLGGSGTISFQEVSVPRIPGYSSVEGMYRIGKILWIGFVTTLVYVIILLLIFIIANPDILVKLGLCITLEKVMTFFGINACTVT